MDEIEIEFGLESKQKPQPGLWPGNVEQLFEYAVKKSPCACREEKRHGPTSTVKFGVKKNKEWQRDGHTDQMNRQEKPPEPRPDFQASPTTLIFERLHLEGRSGGLSIGSPQDLKIRDQLNRGQYDTDTSQQEDDDGCADGPIEGDKKRRNNDKADERGKENVFDVPAHDASARESARSRLFFRPVRIGYAIDASNNTIKTITIGRASHSKP